MKASRALFFPARNLVTFICALLCADAIAQEPKVRTSLSTKGDALVGQRATLVVELLAPGFFASAATFDLPDSTGLLLLPPNGSPTIGSEEISGTSYTVQRHEVSVFARTAGERTIPSFAVRFQFKRQPLDKDAVSASVKTEPLKFTAKSPPGAEKLGGVISARNLTAVETWKPEPGGAKAGAAFTRTVTYSAPDVPAMAFPPFPVQKIDGLGIYPKPPEVLDHSERGSLRGERRDAVTYVCQRPGEYVLPAVRLTWWDLDASQLKVIDFPERRFQVAANPEMASAASAETTSSRHEAWWKPLGWIALGIVAMVALFDARSRRLVSHLIAPFRPVHLAPLNPTSDNP